MIEYNQADLIEAGWRGLEAGSVRDLWSVLSQVNNGQRLHFICRNVQRLDAFGLWEEAVLAGLTDGKVTHYNWSPQVLKDLLTRCDRQKLLDAGDPLPGPGPYRLHRGVAGKQQRRERGLSWTPDPLIAGAFSHISERLGRPLENPCVLTATFDSRHIFAFTDQKGEQEFLVDVPQRLKLRSTPIPYEPDEACCTRFNQLANPEKWLALLGNDR